MVKFNSINVRGNKNQESGIKAFHQLSRIKNQEPRDKNQESRHFIKDFLN